MGKEAYELQGRNGVDVVGVGETFSGRSAGCLVAEAASLTVDFVKPDGVSTASLTLTAAPAGFFTGGTVTTVSVASGQVLVYPVDTNYAIV